MRQPFMTQSDFKRFLVFYRDDGGAPRVVNVVAEEAVDDDQDAEQQEISGKGETEQKPPLSGPVDKAGGDR